MVTIAVSVGHLETKLTGWELVEGRERDRQRGERQLLVFMVLLDLVLYGPTNGGNGIHCIDDSITSGQADFVITKCTFQNAPLTLHFFSSQLHKTNLCTNTKHTKHPSYNALCVCVCVRVRVCVCVCVCVGVVLDQLGLLHVKWLLSKAVRHVSY